MDSTLLTEVALSLSSRRLQLILMPTEQCNFRCTYCYESFSNGRMSQEVQDGVAALRPSTCATSRPAGSTVSGSPA